MIVVGGWPGRKVIGLNGAFGVRPAAFSTGGGNANPLLNDVDAGDTTTEFVLVVSALPGSGVVVLDDYGGFSHVGAADGTYTTTATLYTWAQGGPITQHATPEQITTTFGAGGVTGSSAITLGSVSASMAGAVVVSGSSALAIGSVSASMAGAVAVRGASAAAIGSITGTMAGSAATPGSISGSSSITLGAVQASSAGAVSVSGSSALQLGAILAAAAGAVAVTGAAQGAIGGVTVFSAGTVQGALPISGASSILISSVTGSMTGTSDQGVSNFTPSRYRTFVAQPNGGLKQKATS